MIALIQRVKHARVEVGKSTSGKIGQGLLVFLGVEKDDSEQNADKLVHKLLGYRIFPDEHGKMNQSVMDIKGELLVV